MARHLARRALRGFQIGGFHVKDTFTLVNLLAGVIAVRYVLLDEPTKAGYAVIIGYLGGDLLDGAVARLTNTANRFGAELDSVTDHFVHVMVPGLIFYRVFADVGHGWLGLAGMGALVAAATIRHARLAAARFNYSLCWCGLPRSVSGFAAMSLPLSTVFRHNLPDDVWLGFAIIAVLSLLTLLPIPYLTHRGHRAMHPGIKVLVFLFLISLPVTFVFYRPYLFDVFCFCVIGYALLGWIPVERDERRSFYAEYRRWAAAVAS